MSRVQAASALQRRHPRLARAGARFSSAGLSLPEGAPHGEGYREEPNLDDWLVLLEDYALRCLRPDPSPEAAARYEAIGAALRDLGFNLTRQGIRRGRSDVDRLLTSSAAKSIALIEVINCEYEARSEHLRALVLADTERAAAVADADYERFVRKHLHLFAPSEDGAIEGPAHVHPALSPFVPPPANQFDEINRQMARRAREHDQARERWAIGEPYLGEEHETLIVRPIST